MSAFIAAERLHLRALRPDDAAGGYVTWMNDPEVTRYLESRFTPHSEASLRRFIEDAEGDPSSVLLAIVLTESDQHIGNIKLGPIDQIHRSAHVGLLIGAREHWGHGYATEAIAALSDWAFAELNLHKLNAGCYADNVGSQRAFEKAGYTVEGVRRAQFFSDGRWVDETLLARVAPGS